MLKIKKYLARLLIVLCLSSIITPSVAILSNTPAVVTAQAASYSKSTILQVQKKLNLSGYICGKPDGAVGSKTKAAIKKYQKDNDLKATGTINNTLLKLLNIKATKITYVEKKETIVYVTESGTKYHRAGCRYLWHSKIPMKLSEAKKYYSPCSVCNP
jgi:Putative peptidoglycan-binding domain-containing protein